MSSQSIIFGGGCFWCTEAVFQMLKGIVSVTSGYTGGTTQNPTYEEVCSGTTGHVEAIKVEFDSDIIKLDDLLAVFFTTHDPTTLNRQGNDAGEQYRSAIFYTTPEQKNIIDQFIQKLVDDQVFKDPIVTEVKPASEFYEAEEYHKNYYRNNESKPYCQVVISPKIAKLRKQYSHLLLTN
jgi:peptide-methionine (S)-S-oxide reductase